jgi:uncharacterized protein (DUF433 family)
MIGASEFIVRDPAICGGQPVIKGTRVLLRTILASLAAGDSIDAILADFPTVKKSDIDRVISYAAGAVLDDLPLPKSSPI